MTEPFGTQMLYWDVRKIWDIFFNKKWICKPTVPIIAPSFRFELWECITTPGSKLQAIQKAQYECGYRMSIKH